MTSELQSAARRSRMWLALAAQVVTMMLWSGNMIVGRAMRDEIPPFLLAFARWAIAFAVVLPFAVRRIKIDRPALIAGWKQTLLLGLVGVGSFNAFIYSGLHYTTAANASLLQAAIPMLVLVLNRMIFGVRSGWRQLFGVILSTLGVLVIISHGQLDRLLGLRFGVGDVLVLGGVFAWSLYTCLLRLRPDCHPLSFLAVTFGIGAIAMLLLTFTEWREILAMQWHRELIAAILYVAIFPSIIAYSLFNFAVDEVGPGLAGQSNNLMPLFGVLLAATILGERLFAYHAAGMALITVGIGIGWVAVRNKAAAGY
jgi:drug/metabolite transporter (DMT)-like permease